MPPLSHYARTACAGQVRIVPPRAGTGDGVGPMTRLWHMFIPYTFVVRSVPRRDRIWASAALFALVGIVVYLLLARAARPDFTDYCGWLVGGAAVTLAAVAVLHGVGPDTGLAPITYLLAVASTVAQTLGTA